MDTLALGLLWYWAFLFSTVTHEAAHAWAALRLGDPTAYHGGQVSLNPLPHIKREPLGTVVFPLITYVISGWMMGWASAPYDRAWAERHPRHAAWMSLAGPGANLLIALLVALCIRAGILSGVFAIPAAANYTHVTEAAMIGPWFGPATFLSILFTLNLVLFSFNLIPLFPLDGSVAITLLMGDGLAARYRATMLSPTVSMFGLLIAWQVYRPVFRPLFRLALECLYPGHF